MIFYFEVYLRFFDSTPVLYSCFALAVITVKDKVIIYVNIKITGRLSDGGFGILIYFLLERVNYFQAKQYKRVGVRLGFILKHTVFNTLPLANRVKNISNSNKVRYLKISSSI